MGETSNKKYKVEIWHCHNVIETYKTDNIKDALKWYEENWKVLEDYGMCCVEVYKDDEELDFNTAYEIGFFN